MRGEGVHLGRAAQDRVRIESAVGPDDGYPPAPASFSPDLATTGEGLDDRLAAREAEGGAGELEGRPGNPVGAGQDAVR